MKIPIRIWGICGWTPGLPPSADKLLALPDAPADALLVPLEYLEGYHQLEEPSLKLIKYLVCLLYADAMKIIKFYESSGSLKLRADSIEDLWAIERVVFEGDLVKSESLRKFKGHEGD